MSDKDNGSAGQQGELDSSDQRQKKAEELAQGLAALSAWGEARAQAFAATHRPRFESARTEDGDQSKA